MLAVCLITLLSHGIHFIKVTVDPVELWSSSSSQCRKEREFFNANFKPFFRTAQVIIVPNGIPDVSPNWSHKTIQLVLRKQRALYLDTL